jgi:hypothetical protein
MSLDGSGNTGYTPLGCVALTVDARVGLCRYQFIGVLNQIVFRG